MGAGLGILARASPTTFHQTEVKMATRSIIAKQNDNGYLGIYAHWDGYPGHNGVILHKYYDTDAKVDKLIGLGDISQLAENPDTAQGHSFDNPIPGHVVAYHRDRGEDWESASPKSFDTIDELLDYARSVWAEYAYIWIDDEWFVIDLNKDNNLIPLLDVLLKPRGRHLPADTRDALGIGPDAYLLGYVDKFDDLPAPHNVTAWRTFYRYADL